MERYRVVYNHVRVVYNVVTDTVGEALEHARAADWGNADAYDDVGSIDVFLWNERRGGFDPTPIYTTEEK